MNLKMINAFVREERLPFIQKSLDELGVHGMTINRVMGRGEQKGIAIQFRAGILGIDLLPKVCMEVVVRDELENSVVSAIQNAGKTGKTGDGRIFVMPVYQAVRVRTNEVEV